MEFISLSEKVSNSKLTCKKKKKMYWIAHSSPTVITASHTGVKAEAAQTGKDTLVRLLLPTVPCCPGEGCLVWCLCGWIRVGGWSLWLILSLLHKTESPLLSVCLSSSAGSSCPLGKQIQSTHTHTQNNTRINASFQCVSLICQCKAVLNRPLLCPRDYPLRAEMPNKSRNAKQFLTLTR